MRKNGFTLVELLIVIVLLLVLVSLASRAFMTHNTDAEPVSVTKQPVSSPPPSSQPTELAEPTEVSQEVRLLLRLDGVKNDSGQMVMRLRQDPQGVSRREMLKQSLESAMSVLKQLEAELKKPVAIQAEQPE
jgi:prepilin-type N-terminal cleavage/methylation domain-containing protein